MGAGTGLLIRRHRPAACSTRLDGRAAFAGTGVGTSSDSAKPLVCAADIAPLAHPARCLARRVKGFANRRCVLKHGWRVVRSGARHGRACAHTAPCMAAVGRAGGARDGGLRSGRSEDAPPNDLPLPPPSLPSRIEGTEAALISSDGRFVAFLADRDGQFDSGGRRSAPTIQQAYAAAARPPGPAAPQRHLEDARVLRRYADIDPMRPAGSDPCASFD